MKMLLILSTLSLFVGLKLGSIITRDYALKTPLGTGSIIGETGVTHQVTFYRNADGSMYAGGDPKDDWADVNVEIDNPADPGRGQKISVPIGKLGK